MKKSLNIICILMIFFSTNAISRNLPINPAQYSSDWVFSIENNLNPSKVIYAVHTKNSKMSGTTPVYNYMYRKSGVNPRELNSFEQAMAYGIKKQTMNGSTSVIIVLKKYPHIPITIRNSGRRTRAYVYLQNKEYQLIKIYVKAKAGLFGTEVIYAKLILWDTKKRKQTYRMIQQTP